MRGPTGCARHTGRQRRARAAVLRRRHDGARSRLRARCRVAARTHARGVDDPRRHSAVHCRSSRGLANGALPRTHSSDHTQTQSAITATRTTDNLNAHRYMLHCCDKNTTCIPSSKKRGGLASRTCATAAPPCVTVSARPTMRFADVPFSDATTSSSMPHTPVELATSDVLFTSAPAWVTHTRGSTTRRKMLTTAAIPHYPAPTTHKQTSLI